jgi:hypothetical protein
MLGTSVFGFFEGYTMRQIDTRTEALGEQVSLKPVLEADGSTTGREWSALIIEAGQSLNGGIYPKDVLHRDKSVFEGVPVFANAGPDHDNNGRGSRSLAGFVHALTDDDMGIAGNIHISDPILRETMADLSKNGKLDEFMGLSIVAYGRWEYDTEDMEKPPVLVEFKKGESVDIVRHPAAGGKFIKAIESIREEERSNGIKTTKPVTKRTEGKMTDPEVKALLESDEVKEVLADIVEKAASTAVESALAERDKVEEKDERNERNERNDVSDGGDKKIEENNSPLSHDPRLESFFLANELREAKLPEASSERILSAFKGQPFDSARVATHIKQEKEYLASLTQVAVETITKDRGQVVVDARDKVVNRIDATFEESGKLEVDGVTYPGFTRFTEMWAAWSGADPYSIDRKTMAKRMMEGFDGYDAGDKDLTARISESSLQQSDLGETTADRMHKSMLRNYASFPQYQDWRKIARVGRVDDYQAYRRIKFGGYANLAVVAEKGVYPDLTHPADEETTVTLEKRGGLAPQITRELIINDNIGVIAEIPRELALSASRTLYEQVFDILRLNAQYTIDSTDLFDSAHGSNTGTTALSLAGMDAASVVMRSQTRALATANTLGAQNSPSILVVPNELTGLADRIANPSASFVYTATADANADDNVDRWKNKIEVVTCDYFTDATEYYLVADPSMIMGIEVVFLNGQEEPELFFQRGNEGEGWTMDVESIKIRHEYQEVLHDFRPFFRST